MIEYVKDNVLSMFSWVTDYVYLAEWYVLASVAIATLLVIAWFAGLLPIIGRWIRALTGITILVILAFLVGITVAFTHFRETLAELRKKRQQGDEWWK